MNSRMHIKLMSGLKTGFSSLLATKRVLALPLSAVFLLAVSGCQGSGNIAHQRSIAELNQKAQVMMQSGDYAGAVARLESAHDLEPEEPNTAYNLGMAYQSMGRFDQAIGIFTQILDKPQSGGPEAAEVRKALGITWEAKADKLASDAKAATEEKGKADAAQIQTLTHESSQAYRAAIDNYREAISSGHLKDAADVQHQMDALKERLAKGSHS